MGSLSLLLIEDDLALQEELVNFMDNFFGKIDAVDNAKDALDLYAKSSYDLILTDIELPSENGLFLVKNIKKTNPEQMVIVMSAYQETDYFVESIALHIFSFLVKPFSSEELINTILEATKILEKRHGTDEKNQKKF